MRFMFSAVSAAVCSASAACVFDATVDDGAAQITCDADVDCPPTWTCAATLCVAPADVVAPRVVAASFEPALARANVPVRLTIIADETLGAAPLPRFTGDLEDGGDLVEPLPVDEPGLPGAAPVIVDGFELVERDGARAVFTRTFAFAFGDGDLDLDIVLESVELEDVEGNRATALVGAPLQVDRTPPLLLGIRADRARYSAVAPFNEVSGTVELGENLQAPASLAVFLGDRPLGCIAIVDSVSSTPEAGEGGADAAPLELEPIDCGGFVDDTTPQGAVVLQAVASDAAGNITVVGTSVTIDRTAPAVAAQPPPTVAITGGGAAAFTPTLVVGAAVTVSFRSDEPLTAATVVAVREGADDDAPAAVLSFTTELDPVDRARVVATFRVLEPLPLGTYRIEASLVDDVGNASLAHVVLAPQGSGLVVSEGAPSPCIATIAEEQDNGAPPDAAARQVCTDFDHDGHFGVSAACTGEQATDCHDDDPFVHPAAFDIPGDLTDNVCGGSVGAPLNDSGARFVALDGDDANPGTPAAPKRTLAAAVGSLVVNGNNAGGPRVIAMRAGDYGDEQRVFLPAAEPFVVLGGFDLDWRPGGVSSVRIDCPETDQSAIASFGDIILVDVALDTVSCSRALDGSGAQLRRAALLGDCSASVDGCYVGAFAPLLAWRSTLSGVRVFSPDVTLLDSDVIDGSLFGESLTLVRTHVSGDTIINGGDVLLASSAVLSSLGATTRLRAYQSTLASALIFNASDTSVLIDNSLVVMSDVMFGIEFDGPGHVTLRGSDIAAPCITPACTGTVAACTFNGCLASTQSFSAPPLLDVDGVHLTAGSPLRDAGVSDSVNLGAPTAIAADIDGECRTTGDAPDVGADEFD